MFFSVLPVIVLLPIVLFVCAFLSFIFFGLCRILCFVFSVPNCCCCCFFFSFAFVLIFDFVLQVFSFVDL